MGYSVHPQKDTVDNLLHVHDMYPLDGAHLIFNYLGALSSVYPSIYNTSVSPLRSYSMLSRAPFLSIFLRNIFIISPHHIKKPIKDFLARKKREGFRSQYIFVTVLRALTADHR
jgi:hypothetical protein